MNQKIKAMNKNELEEIKDAFNELYKIGTELIIVDDFGKESIHKLKSKAWIAGNNIIALFEGIPGGYDIKRVRNTLTTKTNIL